MELKPYRTVNSLFFHQLLIRPKWNWNPKENVKMRIAVFLLIRPKWNWNELKVDHDPIITSLLIRPKWNWNYNEFVYRDSDGVAFNQTKMELKHRIIHICITRLDPFNQTKMELKQFLSDPTAYQWKLLIRPKWNWNWFFINQHHRIAFF